MKERRENHATERTETTWNRMEAEVLKLGSCDANVTIINVKIHRHTWKAREPPRGTTEAPFWRSHQRKMFL